MLLTNNVRSFSHCIYYHNEYILLLHSFLVYNLAAPNDNPSYEELRIAMAKAQGRTEKIEYKEAEKNVPTRWDTDS